MPTWKIRITADTEEDAETLRQALMTMLPGMTCRKARAGSNPKYEGQQKYLAYGEITITTDALRMCAEPTRPARTVKASPATSKDVTYNELLQAGAVARSTKVVRSEGKVYEETSLKLNGKTYMFRRVKGGKTWKHIQ